MAHFFGTLQGQRGEATRLGSKKSGIEVSARGWNSGVEIEGLYNAEKDRDEFDVYVTSGSGYGGYGCYRTFLGTAYAGEGGELKFDLAISGRKLYTKVLPVVEV